MLVLKFEDVFPNENKKNFEDYLMGIEKSTLISIGIAFINLFNREEFSDPEYYLSNFFNSQNRPYAGGIWKRVQLLQKGYRTKFNPDVDVTFFSVLNSLYFFEYVLTIQDYHNSKSKEEIERDIFKAFLVLNDKSLFDFELISIDSTKNLDSRYTLFAKTFTSALPHYEFTHVNLNSLMICEFIRAHMLFEFLEKHHPVLVEEFLKYFNLNNWLEYLNKLVFITFSAVSKPGATYLDFDNSSNQDGFLELLSINDKTFLSDLDFRTIRSSPILKMNSNTYRVISVQFLIEFIYKSLRFKLKDINNLLPNAEEVKDLQRIYTLDFSEKICSYIVLRKCFGGKYKQLTGNDIEGMGIKGAPDYYVRNGKYVFLFESKDVMLKSEVKQSGDFELYKKALDEKFYFEKNKKGKIVRKAILQLINSIKSILKCTTSYDKDIPKNVIVYPLLLVHDRLFNVPGLNKYLNHIFQQELKTLAESGYVIDNVKPLILIDIDTLVYHQDNFTSKNSSLQVTLDGYLQFIDHDKRMSRKIKSEPEAFDSFEKSLLSYADYARDFFNSRGLHLPPKMFKEKVYSIAQENIELLSSN